MRIVASVLISLTVAFGLYVFYLKRLPPGASGGASREAVSVVGVQGDLLRIAQAERVYFAEHNSYTVLGELTASGTLSLPRAGRDGYTYSVEPTPDGFIATARYTGRPATRRGSTIQPLSWIKPCKCGKARERLAGEQMRKRLALLAALFLVAGVTLALQARQQHYLVYGLRFWSATSTPASA